MKKEELMIDVKVNDEELNKFIDKAQELEDILPTILVKNNENVYITINHFKDDGE